MFSHHDTQFLTRALTHNRCVLFVGAGLSQAAVNQSGMAMPSGRALARILWDWLFDAEYDQSPLADIYQAALDSGRPLRQLKYFLEEHLLAADVPKWYHRFSHVYWHRIYGTNVDDVVERAFRDSGEGDRLSVIVAPHQQYNDRDQFLRSIQYVKLNGTLPGDPRELTFATRQYAQRLATYDTWYHHFVRDYVLHPTVFIGTQLDEPIFWQAIVSRQPRGENGAERPRSFLVSPSLSPAKFPVLKQLNIRHVQGTAEEFAHWLTDNYRFPTARQVLNLIAPELGDVVGDPVLLSDRDAIIDLVSVFRRVQTDARNPHHTKEFFLGTPPSWSDIVADFDAPREITQDMMASVKSALKQQPIGVIGLVGSGGSGKSTTLMRLALTLRQSGREVLFSDGADRPDVESVARGLQSIGERAILFIDNANLLGPVLRHLLSALAALPKPPVVVFASRFALVERDIPQVVDDPNVSIHTVPDLTDKDIENLLTTLGRERQLGRLEPLSHRDRVHAFKIRARKQILVAMREATEGQGFNEIMRSEFTDIIDREPRVLYLCAALATAELIDMSVGQWLACAEVSTSTAMGYLSRSLRGLVLVVADGNRVAPRHAVIAHYIVGNVADRGELAVAYQRVLAALSHETYGGRGRRGRSWRLVVRLINHRRVFERFSDDIVRAREIYDSIGEWFRRDGHYWLQYANLEIEYGTLTYARPHLAHAQALMPGNHQVQTSRAHLMMKESLVVGDYEEAFQIRRDGCTILLEQMSERSVDLYPQHVYLTQNLAWIQRWERERSRRVTAMSELKEMADRLWEKHPRSRRLKVIRERIHRAYLELGVSPERR